MNKTLISAIDPNAKQWVLIDLQDQTLGRAAVQAVKILRGKHKPTFAPHQDCGDHVVVINASAVKVSGNKAKDRFRYHYTGYPGGLRKTSIGDQVAKHPARAFMWTVRKMLPKNSLGRKILTHLHVYPGSEHPHVAQRPVSVKLEKE